MFNNLEYLIIYCLKTIIVKICLIKYFQIILKHLLDNKKLIFEKNEYIFKNKIMNIILIKEKTKQIYFYII